MNNGKIMLFSVLILALSMSMACLSLSDASEGGGAEPVAEVDGIKYTDLQTAIDNADDDTVKLISNVILTGGGDENYALNISGRKVTIDLNGYEIKYVTESTTGVYRGLIKTENNAYLILKDSSEAENGKIYATNLNYCLVDNSSSCSIIIENGKYHVENLVKEDGRGMIYTRCNAEDTDGVLTGLWIKGGTFRLDDVGRDENGVSPWIISASGDSAYEVKIIGGTFNGDIQNQRYMFESEVPKGYALRSNADGTFTVVPAVCFVNVQWMGDKWYTYEYGCESFEKALEKISWYEDDAGKNGGYGNTITMLDDCCINDLRIPEDVEFNLKAEGTLYALPNTDTSGLKVHFIPQDGDTCTLHISSSPYECKGGYCTNEGCGEDLPPVRNHLYDPSITCIVQECEECGIEISRSTDHDYEIIGDQKICSMCGDTIQLPSQDGSGSYPPDHFWPNNQSNQTTQNSSNQLEVSDIVTGTMVVIAVAILGMIIFDVVRKP